MTDLWAKAKIESERLRAAFEGIPADFKIVSGAHPARIPEFTKSGSVRVRRGKVVYSDDWEVRLAVGWRDGGKGNWMPLSDIPDAQMAREIVELLARDRKRAFA